MIFLPKVKNGSIIEQNMENFGFPGISREISMISREFPVSRELEKSGKYKFTSQNATFLDADFSLCTQILEGTAKKTAVFGVHSFSAVNYRCLAETFTLLGQLGSNLVSRHLLGGNFNLVTQI